MEYYSISDKTHKATFAQAMVNGLAPNQGLYFPERIPVFSQNFFVSLSTLTLPQVAAHVLTPYVNGNITADALQKITQEVFNFEIPLVQVEDGIYALELFHGPTLAFKDVGARFLAHSMQHLNKNKVVRILVATSGDTGSAVANGFYGVEGTEVVVLYPKGKVSEIQQKQFATLGKNIIPIAIEGTFDDCQHLVKQAFTDEALNKKMSLSSANSINIARWVPQSVYYYWALAQLPRQNKPICVSVPSGNLGNLTSGLLAKKTGLPINHFIAASNSNDIVPQYLGSGNYNPKPSIQTIANAMDVGNPNNFPRLQELYGKQFSQMASSISGYAYSDNDIKNIIRQCQADNSYLLDPHGATGYASAKSFCKENNHVGVFLETAHPGKFIDEVEKIIDTPVELPEKLKAFNQMKIVSETLPADFKTFKQFLFETHKQMVQ